MYSDSEESLVIQELLNGMGASPLTLKKLVRPMFIAPTPEEVLAVSDFSAIEARCLAWEAGEDWVLQAFREKRDLYVESATRMGGGMGRPEGKIAVLAAGYQGSVGSFRNMGYGGRRCPFDTKRQSKVKDPRSGHEYEKAFENIAEHTVEAAASVGDVESLVHPEAYEQYRAKAQRLKIPMDDVTAAIQGHIAERARDKNHKCDPDIKAIVDAWREANPQIKNFWYDLERKFWTGGSVGAGKIHVEVDNSKRIIHLPSGRRMIYRHVAKRDVTVVDEESGEKSLRRGQLSYLHIQGYREKTYGGRLTENVTQGVARDLLADALIRLDAAGYRVVGHVHDEVIVETSDLDGVNAIMKVAPAWAEGMPMDASGFTTYRYKKD